MCIYACVTNMQEFHKKQTCTWYRKLSIVIYMKVYMFLEVFSFLLTINEKYIVDT